MKLFPYYKKYKTEGAAEIFTCTCLIAVSKISICVFNFAEGDKGHEQNTKAMYDWIISKEVVWIHIN